MAPADAPKIAPLIQTLGDERCTVIPRDLNEQHFVQAAVEIDREGVPAKRRSVHYDLVLNGKYYPPKYVISLATKYATVTEHPADSFDAVEAKKYFLDRGYEVIDRRSDATYTER